MKRGTPDHPKTLALMEELDLQKWQAVGILESLWHFTARFSPRGDVGKWTDTKIAEGVGWTADSHKLISALLKSGWIDSDKAYRYLIHDWPEHCDQGVKKFLARNKLRFATASGRRPSRVRTQDRPPLPLPSPRPSPRPTDETTSPPETGLKGEQPPEEEITCPACRAQSTIVREPATRIRNGKPEPRHNPGWFCGTNKGGCGQAFDLGEHRIVDQLPEHVQRSVESERRRRLEAIASDFECVLPETVIEPDPEAVAITKRIVDRLRSGVNEHVHATWFRPLAGLDVRHSVLRIVAPNATFVDWLTKNYRGHIGSALEAEGVQLGFEIVSREDVEGRSPPLDLMATLKESLGRRKP